MKLGVIGVGHLASALLEGLDRSGFAAGDILLSPRGRAGEIARRRGLQVGTDNEAVVDGSDIVLLAVRPGAATEAVAGLPWREGQILLSACAGVPIRQLPVAPARVVRIMPITAAALAASPTLMYPVEPEAETLASRFGPVIALDAEEDFEVATASAAIYGWAQELIRVSVEWSRARGLDEGTARRLHALTFVAAGRMVDESPASLETLIGSLATPGGITQAGLDRLREGQALDVWEKACDTVLARLRTR